MQNSTEKKKSSSDHFTRTGEAIKNQNS